MARSRTPKDDSIPSGIECNTLQDSMGQHSSARHCTAQLSTVQPPWHGIITVDIFNITVAHRRTEVFSSVDMSRSSKSISGLVGRSRLVLCGLGSSPRRIGNQLYNPYFCIVFLPCPNWFALICVALQRLRCFALQHISGHDRSHLFSSLVSLPILLLFPFPHHSVMSYPGL